jgi:hypothetical protein
MHNSRRVVTKNLVNGRFSQVNGFKLRPPQPGRSLRARAAAAAAIKSSILYFLYSALL